MAPPRLTPQLLQTITAFIRSGGYPHVAAEAAGVPRDLFESWLKRGQNPRAGRLYRDLAQAVMEAFAQSRLRAEITAFQEKPLDWLRGGPGKAGPDSPGWSAPVRSSSPSPADVPLTLDHPQLQLLLATLLEVLAPFPDARAAIAQHLQATGQVPPEAPSSGQSSPDRS